MHIAFKVIRDKEKTVLHTGYKGTWLIIYISMLQVYKIQKMLLRTVLGNLISLCLPFCKKTRGGRWEAEKGLLKIDFAYGLLRKKVDDLY